MSYTSLRFVALAALAFAIPFSEARAKDPKFGTTATSVLAITYVTATTAYLDAGAGAGLEIGDVFEVIRGGAVVTTIQVEALSSKRASCRRVDPAVPIETGLQARWTRDPPKIAAPVSLAESSDPPPSPVAASGFTGRLRELGLRGRIGFRYVGIRDRGDLARDFNQPGLDLRVDGRSVGGSGFGLLADLRAQRTIRTVGREDDIVENRTRVYRLSADWKSAAHPVHAAVGRQLSLAIASIGVFDGAAADVSTRRWTFGALAGSQPDPATFGFSSEIVEGGAFAELRSENTATTRWKVALGAITSRNGGEIHRDFAALQATASATRAQVTWIQEVDWNRGWRREAEGEALDITSTFVSVRAPVGSRLVANAGWDNRRTVRLFRDEITPETDFDDRYRQGAWGGVDARVSSGGRIGVSVRRHSGGASGEARSATLVASVRGGGWREASLHARSTRYEGIVEDGWLHSAGVGASPMRRLHADVTGGMRSTNPKGAFENTRRETWVSLDLECPITNPLYVLLSTEQSWDGEGGASLQVFGSAVVRF